jgi:hypothetical protein
MPDVRNERREFTRVSLDLPITIHQGADKWSQRLVDISLSGVSTDQPEVWDAQYNEPFTLVITLDDDSELELHAYLQHVEAQRLGFTVRHVDRENIEPLMELLGQHMDMTTLAEELSLLD